MEEGRVYRCDPAVEVEEGHVQDVYEVHVRDLVVEVYARGVVGEDDALYRYMAYNRELAVELPVHNQAVVDGIYGLCHRVVDGSLVCHGVHRGELAEEVGHVHAPVHGHILVAVHGVSSPLHHAVCPLHHAPYHLMTPLEAPLHRQVEVLLVLLAVAQR